MREGPGLPPGHPARATYRDAAAAEAYARSRFAKGTGPATDRREREALADLLAARGFEVTAADQSPAMLAHAAGALAAAGLPRRMAAADALALPFRPATFDLVLCHRLLHHLEKEAERRALLGSLAAASRRWVLVSWFDARSLQHLRRALRRPFRPSRRHAVDRATPLRDAAASGLRTVALRALRPWVSELTFALLERA